MNTDQTHTASSSEPFDPEDDGSYSSEGAGPQDASEPRAGEMHPVDRAFYELAIKERDYERLRASVLQERLMEVGQKLGVAVAEQHALAREVREVRIQLEGLLACMAAGLRISEAPERVVYGSANAIAWLQRELEWLAEHRTNSESL